MAMLSRRRLTFSLRSFATLAAARALVSIGTNASIPAFYAGFATGETDALIGGPTILQKFYQEGVPLRIFGTGFTLSDLAIFAKDDKIKSLADLKGKQLAADMGSSQFQVIKMYANATGIE